MEEKIDVLKEDITPYVYFVCSMSQQSTMFGALGGKSDFIGGIFDRWINIIPESLIFNKNILPKAIKEAKTNKSVRVYSDFFKYDPKIVGIAPDVFGLLINNKIIPFIKYDDTQEKKDYWVAQEGCPQIEVKSFKGKQYMVSLRDQHYGEKFLVLVSMDLSTDYLLPFFDSSFITNQDIEKLKMPDEFIISNEKELLNQTEKVNFNKGKLGTLELLKVTTAQRFKDVALKLDGGGIPRFFKDVVERKTYIKQERFKIQETLDKYCDLKNSGLYRFNSKWYELFNTNKEKTLDLDIENVKSIQIINKTNDAITVLVLDNAVVNGYKLSKGKQYNINFGTFGSVAGEEYFINKSVLNKLPDEENKLVNVLSTIIKNN